SASTPPMSSPTCSSASGASTHAPAGMLRSRWGVAGRSAVWTGVRSTGRWSYRRALPASIDPLLQMGTLGPDGRVVAVAGHDDRVVRDLREQALVDGADDAVEVAARELGGARPAREQRVAAEQHGRSLDAEADRSRRVARR